MKDPRSQILCHLCCSVCGIVIDDDDLVDEGRHAVQHFNDALLFVKAWYDYSDSTLSIHGSRMISQADA
jgi:hypothetical protein